jgi:pSer/pThr/pTyr-binding forkhead associated (FHA) protein
MFLEKLNLGSTVTNIEITYGEETKVFEPGQKITIGRSDESTIHIDDKQVSRYHSQIVYEEALGAWIFSDLGSANSSIIDGEEVKTKELLGPQTIKLGFYDGAPTLHTLVRIDSTELDDATIVVNRSELNDTTESQVFEAPVVPAPQPAPEPSNIQIPAPVTVPLTPAPEPKVEAERKFCPRCGAVRVGNFCGGCGFDYRQ